MKPMNTIYPKASHEAPKPMAIHNEPCSLQNQHEHTIFELFSIFLYFLVIFGF